MTSATSRAAEFKCNRSAHCLVEIQILVIKLQQMRISQNSLPLETIPSPGIIINSDSRNLLDYIEPGTVDFILTSPPYNLGKLYERGAYNSNSAYLAFIESVVDTIDLSLNSNGSVCWQSGNYVSNSEIIPLDYFAYNIFVKKGYKLRNRIVWTFNYGLHGSKRLSGRYETILWFTKSTKYTFNLDSIRVPQKYPGKTHSAKKGLQAGKPRRNPKERTHLTFGFLTQRSSCGNPRFGSFRM